MARLHRGLYESLITEDLAHEIDVLGAAHESRRDDLRTAEAADRIALHIARAVKRAVQDYPEHERVTLSVGLARRLIDLLGSGARGDSPLPPGTVLRAINGRRPDGAPEDISEPLVPLLDTTLLTNAPGEPRVGMQLQAEIASSDRIDVVMAFIRMSGVRAILEALRTHCAAQRQLRVLTTIYTGSTEAQALDILKRIGARVRVSYDTSTTRLHAKAWLFHRATGFSTAYIGSSNLTHSAQVAGLEWNVRVAAARNPDVVDKVTAVFESYWNGGDFVDYDPAEFLARTGSARPETRFLLSPIELRPEPFQERLLEQVALARQLGRHRNLLVSATGTGKTVMAAIDYVRLRPALPRARLLFVAHREEILEQSLLTFRHALRDHSFGELWVGGRRPESFEHVFASIQSLHASGLDALDPTHFDVVIVDEFHHAAAHSYRALLDYVTPVELLGLTATPERSDGLPVLGWFNNRIAAELRLWDAIDQHRLCPFLYYGIHDGLDLRDVPWRRGRGYDVDGLSNLLTASDAWAHLVLKQLHDHVDDISGIRALGFCVSVEHARFMARVFNEAGVESAAVWGDTPEQERHAALARLARGDLRVVFSVDLFNEGIDVPAIDTLLLLRPTDSATLFLQQIGRGLRRWHGKLACTVLDFVGLHRAEFRFDRRFRALLGGSRRDLLEQIEQGFPFLPSGCHVELDRKASEIVLCNIREAVPSRWPAKVAELRAAPTPSLAGFLSASGLELEDVYDSGKSWSDLRADAGLAVLPAGPHEGLFRRACGRLLHIDDTLRIQTFRSFLERGAPPRSSDLSEHDCRLLRMLVGSVADQAVNKSTTLDEGSHLLWQHPQVRSELIELLDVLSERIGHLSIALATREEVPLRVHARYTRLEMLSAFGVGDGAKIRSWQTGVLWAEQSRADLLAFTLDKTSGKFSPTTRYRDYAISRELIHWESQSATKADSEPGQRYQHHAQLGSAIMLFARLRTDERAFTFLGPAQYVSHEGERPMAVTWRLEHPLPGDLFASFAAAVA